MMTITADPRAPRQWIVTTKDRRGEVTRREIVAGADDEDGVRRLLEEAQAPRTPTLDELRAQALEAIDAAFEARAAVPPAVARVRAVKCEEAELVLHNSGGDPNEYPTLAASVLAGETLLQAAERVFAAAEADNDRLARLEAIRIASKAAVRAARSPEALAAAQAAIDWGGA